MDVAFPCKFGVHSFSFSAVLQPRATSRGAENWPTSLEQGKFGVTKGETLRARRAGQSTDLAFFERGVHISRSSYSKSPTVRATVRITHLKMDSANVWGSSSPRSKSAE